MFRSVGPLIRLCLLGPAVWIAAAPQQGPVSISLLESDGRTAIVVSGCNAASLASIAEGAASAPDWTSVFQIWVASAPDGAPSLLGSYEVRGAQLLFVPRYPLEPGLRYRARFEARPPLQCGDARVIVSHVQVAKSAPAAATFVVRVEPTADLLPENLLKFYIYFSGPMSQGEAYAHMRLLDAAGRPIELPFLELESELWDPQGSRLTLLFDPGRVKRGLLPYREVGPPLEEGRHYTFEVDSSWQDASGRSMSSTFRKSFDVGSPDRESPDPALWVLAPVSPETTGPLSVAFGEPLDGALLRRQLAVFNVSGVQIEGRVELADGERRWLFHPESPWWPGRYELVIGTTLEDLAGNSVGRPFEVNIFERVEARVTGEKVSLPFEILPRQRQ